MNFPQIIDQRDVAVFVHHHPYYLESWKQKKIGMNWAATRVFILNPYSQNRYWIVRKYHLLRTCDQANQTDQPLGRTGFAGTEVAKNGRREQICSFWCAVVSNFNSNDQYLEGQCRNTHTFSMEVLK
ncbi:hypothetical protein [Brevibacillus sp. SYSU BS000544]|uniref:hypothetical protein n=1 Tax=Brevibacillus sp. SYSU BS000544 TaxID=3416443 RepID=UPI003CE58625